jgi:hypothetical protein
MLRPVALVRTDVSEELSASIIRVTRIVELGKLAVTSNRRKLMMEALSSFEMSIITRATRRKILQDAILKRVNIFFAFLYREVFTEVDHCNVQGRVRDDLPPIFNK